MRIEFCIDKGRKIANQVQSIQKKKMQKELEMKNNEHKMQ